MSYPDFVCMGFQKCGTTTLYELLEQHPGVALCRDVKEPMYYRVPVASVIGGGKRYYKKRYFGHLSPADSRILGEANAGLTFSGCAKKLKKNLPSDTKLIFMFRDPIERSYSAYKYFLARGFLPKDVWEFDKENGHGAGFDFYVRSVLDSPKERNQIMKKRLKYLVLSQSNYGTCIKEYTDFVEDARIRFVLFEEFVKDEQAACRALYEFIGVSDVEGIGYGLASNTGHQRATSARAAKKFYWAKGARYLFFDLLAMTYWAPGLYKRFFRHFEKVRREVLVEDADHGKVLPETRQYLEAYFDPEMQLAEEITGRPLRALWNWSSLS